DTDAVPLGAAWRRGRRRTWPHTRPPSRHRAATDRRTRSPACPGAAGAATAPPRRRRHPCRPAGSRFPLGPCPAQDPAWTTRVVVHLVRLPARALDREVAQQGLPLASAPAAGDR